MAITFGTHSGVGSTVALLEAELPRLEEQQHTLERELAEIVERLEAVRSALGGLRSLSSAPLLEVAAATAAPAEQEPVAAVAVGGAVKRRRAKSAPQPPAAEPAPVGPARKTAAGKTAAVRKKTAGKKAAGKAPTSSARTGRPVAGTAKAAAAAAAQEPAAVETAGPKKRTSDLADNILAYLADADGPARAGDIAQALGRETTPGSVNAVRTSLERLVKASKAQRTGRGLYQALPR